MVDSAKSGTANIALFIIQIVSAVSGFVISASCMFLRKWHPPIAYTAAFHISFWIGIQALITHTGSAISVRLPDASQDMQNNKPLIRFLIWAQFAMPLWFVFLNVAIATDLMFSQLFRLNITRLQAMHRWYLPVATLMAFTLALPLLIYHSEYQPSANVFSVQFPSALSVTLYYILAFDVWIAIGIVYCFVVVSLVVSIIVIKLRKKRAAWNEHNLAQLEGNIPPQSIQIPKRPFSPSEKTTTNLDTASATINSKRNASTSQTPSPASGLSKPQPEQQQQQKENRAWNADNNDTVCDESRCTPPDSRLEDTKPASSLPEERIPNRKSVLFLPTRDSTSSRASSTSSSNSSSSKTSSSNGSRSSKDNDSHTPQSLGLKKSSVSETSSDKRKDLHISGATAIDHPNIEQDASRGIKPPQLSASTTLHKIETEAMPFRRRTLLKLAGLPPPFTLRSSHRSVLACQPGASAPFRIPTLALVRLLLYPLIPIFSFTLMVVVRWVWFRSNLPSRWEVLNVVSGFLRALEGFLCLIVFLLNPALNRSFREIRKRNTPQLSQ
ncbi:hypothetical protein H4217_004834 [Coemansia sp. RSA 1939]|nr:hypothetical protein H4217_004834 [Coemansia sp. RSA 1939]KAJ2607792.1 hypothetical protein EV177_005322 [Coemansia sp. RSA 1804]